MMAPESNAAFDVDQQRAQRLERQRGRMAAHRERRRKGSVQVRVDVSREHIAALERLGLFDPDAPALAWAVARYLDTARHVAGVGDALYPEAEGWEA